MKKYTLTIEETESNLHVQSNGSGFSAFELLGLLSHVERQIAENIKPDNAKSTDTQEEK